MGKRQRERDLDENEAKAVSKMLRISPQKLNLVAQLIPNAENNHDLDVDDLIVAEAHVGKALVIKRFTPRGRGRVGRIFKPFSHLTIVVRQVEARAEA
jgi:large subunit ribosomal protein L22